MKRFKKLSIGITIGALVLSNLQITKSYATNLEYKGEITKLENSENINDSKQDVYTNSPFTAKEINLNEKYQYLAKSYSSYWVKFTVPEQGYITIKHEKPIDSSGEVGDMRFKLIDSNSEEIKEISTRLGDVKLNPNYEYKIGLKPGEYYLDLKSTYRIQSGLFFMDYSIDFTPTKNFEIENNDNKYNATDIKLNTPMSGYGDQTSITNDFYKIYVEKDTKVKFKTKSKIPHGYIILPDGERKNANTSNMNTDEEGYMYSYYMLRKGINYIEISGSYFDTDYTIELEEASNNLPVIKAEDKVFSNDEYIYSDDLLKGVTAYDQEDGDLTSKIRIVENTVKSRKEGTYKVVYEVEDSDKNKVRKEIKVIVGNDMESIKQGNVIYQTHVQDYGWQDWKSNGEMSGTEGQSKRLEGIRINISDMIPGASIKYRTHIQDYGWQDWKYNGEMSGTEGQSKRLEGIEIKLENAPGYSVEYRTHVQDYGWQDWKRNGEMSGTEGQAKRLEGIEIRIVKNK